MSNHEKTARELYGPAMLFIRHTYGSHSPEMEGFMRQWFSEHWRQTCALCVYWMQRRTQAENNGVRG